MNLVNLMNVARIHAGNPVSLTSLTSLARIDFAANVGKSTSKLTLEGTYPYTRAPPLLDVSVHTRK